ncbi:MAG TPA: response regulator [Candidatus Hypogeohydataceae bacterium YC41]
MARDRILIIEESRQIVDELRDNLELAGFETEVALNFQVAYAILEERKMNLAIVGSSFQEINTIRKLCELDNTLPIIFLSEQKSKRYQSTLIKAGASAILELPLDKDQVIEKIEKLVEKPEVLPLKMTLKTRARKMAIKGKEKKKRTSSAS